MSTSTIVFFGRNPSIMALVKNQLTGGGFVAEGFLEDAPLLERLAQGNVSLLILGAGIEDGPRLRLRERCTELDLRLLEFYGGPDQLMQSVQNALR
jgi:hypothetical protein